MPNLRYECRHCQKNILAFDRFSHLNAKHKHALWSLVNRKAIEDALNKSCETHQPILKIDGETYYYSPYSDRLYSSVPKYLISQRKVLKQERAVIWKSKLEHTILGFSEKVSLETPRGVNKICSLLETLLQKLDGGGEANLKIINATVVDGNHSGAEDGGVGEDEAGADEDD
tara:strand:- start:20 stop:535 length:516 start_codon:yes stop_codon:yes gene_type:complete